LAKNHRVERYTASQKTLAYARRTLAVAQELESASRIAHGHFGVGFLLLWHGDLDSAERELETGLRLAQKIGYLTIHITCLVYLAILQRKRGRVAVVQELSSETLALTNRAGEFVYTGTVNGNLAWVAWRQGRLAQVTTHGQEALVSWQSVPAFSGGAGRG
jgi:hypothetical protein